MARRRHRSQPATDSGHLTPKEITAAAAARYGVPFWLLWGTAGAESTWKRGGANIFGLTAAAEGVDVSNWSQAANQAAKTYARLKREYGSWAAAVPHYSGNSYSIEHPQQLAAETGVTPQNSHAVTVGLGEDLFGKGLGGKIFENFVNPLHISPGKGEVEGPELAPGAGNISPGEALSGAGSALDVIGEFFGMLVEPKFWLRVGEGVGGAILIYMGLKALTGTEVSDVPGVSTARSYAKAAAFKSLPPKTRTS